jgi:hypothetical protein
MHYRRGWPVPLETIHLELFRLLTVYAASRSIAEAVPDENHPFSQLRSYFEQTEASRLMISIAATVRSTLDSAIDTETLGKLLSPPVGTLIQDTDKPTQTKPLSLRECCNKILHADLIHFDLTEAKEWHKQAINPVMYLYGVHRRRAWKATIDILKFVELAYWVQ